MLVVVVVVEEEEAVVCLVRWRVLDDDEDEGFFIRPEVADEARPPVLLSMMAVAKEADFLRANLLLLSAEAACWASAALLLLPFPAEADAEVDADAEADVDAVGLLVSHAFLAARPLTSPTSSAADFFLVFSSSEDRLEDMMVSRVLYAALRRLPPPFLLLGWDRAELSSSGCRVGPPAVWL